MPGRTNSPGRIIQSFVVLILRVSHLLGQIIKNRRHSPDFKANGKSQNTIPFFQALGKTNETLPAL